MKKNKGFTLIELIVVIVILGILAATAMPKFVDLSLDARNAVTQAVMGSISSGSQLNYSGCLLAPTDKAKCLQLGSPNASAAPQLGGATATNVCTAAMLAPLVVGATSSGATMKVGNSTYTIAKGTTGSVSCAAAATSPLATCNIVDTTTSATAYDFTVVCTNQS